MNAFMTSGAERLRKWRRLRQYIDKSMTDFEQLQEVVHWWAECPMSARIIDPYTPESWPTGWELMHYGDFCRSAIGLGMEQTLLLRNGRWNNERVKLALIDDRGEDLYLAPIIDNKWILNYNHGEVTWLEDVDDIQIKEMFQFDGKKHQEMLT